MMKAEAMGKKVVMTADDRMIEGIEMASLAVDSRFDFAKNHLTRAINNVKKSRRQGYGGKGQVSFEGD
jgi:phosphoribosylaminoimidazole carboxylase (NCAIR synthetase)